MGGLPDADHFRLISTALIADARSASRNGRIRLCGEMVNLLWRMDQEQAAVKLESLWNEAIVTNAVPLFCAYHVEEGGSLPAALCEAHTHVAPVAAGA